MGNAEVVGEVVVDGIGRVAAGDALSVEENAFVEGGVVWYCASLIV